MDRKWSRLPYIIALFIGGVILNLVGSGLMHVLHLPLYLDCIGTILAAGLGGYLPAILIGYISNLIIGLNSPTSIYFAFTSVLIAFAAGHMFRHNYFKRVGGCITAILVFSVIGGGIGSCITWLLDGGEAQASTSPFLPFFTENAHLPAFWAQLIADLLIDIIDKAIQVVIVLVIMRLIPQKLHERFFIHRWRQTPLTDEERSRAREVTTRGMSLKARIVLMISMSTLLMAIVTTGVSGLLYHRAITDGQGLTEIGFMTRVVTLIFGFFIIVLGCGLWVAEYSLLLPVYAMTDGVTEFAYNSMEARQDSVERFAGIRIRTGDELENLYTAFSATIAQAVMYLEESQTKSQILGMMQNSLILVLADLVESRDKCTGDHVRKTAAYVRIILEQMQEDGIYPEIVTPSFIDDVANSAPLHDVGKISVPDSILNKPGKLTEEEFEIMKTHTVAGRQVIDEAIALVPYSGYLLEARNLASCHHEKWNGTGYPYGYKGEEIPLSARVMAVADVFDALVSRRSYKEPFPYSKAVSIIEEGAGSHFDPKVVDAFLRAQDKVKDVYQQTMNKVEATDAAETAELTETEENP